MLSETIVAIIRVEDATSQVRHLREGRQRREIGGEVFVV
jgi:hypothetical protein